MFTCDVLHSYLFQYYYPVGRRFIWVDPIGLAGGMNTYGYVGDPLVWVDPLGLSPCTGNHAKESNIVYRALTREDAARVAAGKSIQGKAMNGTWTAAEHVANQPLSKDSIATGGP